MKKVIYSIIGFVALAILASAIYFGSTKGKNPFTNAPTDEQIIAADGDVPAEDTGEELRNVIVVEEPSTDEIPNFPPEYGPQFSNLTISLATELPTAEQTSLPNYAVNFDQGLTVEEIQEIAHLFGFTGELYQERIDERYGNIVSEEAAATEADASSITKVVTENATEVMTDTASAETPPEMFRPPASYAVFDGTRVLRAYGSSVNFYDTAIQGQWQPTPLKDRLPYEKTLAIAKSYLLERDLLPDQYTDKEGYNGEVQFFELLDGAMFNRPVAMVNVSKDGQVGAVTYMPTISLNKLDENSLISAETAYNALLEAPGRYEFNYMPTSALSMEDPYLEANHWQRGAGDEQAVNRMTWLQIYDSVTSDDILILAENMRVSGNPEIIAQLAATDSRSVLLTGTISEQDGIDTIEVSAFEPADELQRDNNVYLNGQIKLNGSEAQLVIAGGLSVILPDAPADLEDGMQVSVYGWSISDAEDGRPVFDWISIDEQIDNVIIEEQYQEEMGPFGAKELTVDTISLIYQPDYNLMAMYERSSMPYGGPNEIFVPAWQFSGTTDSGALLEFWVPAIDLSNAGN